VGRQDHTRDLYAEEDTFVAVDNPVGSWNHLVVVLGSLAEDLADVVLKY
jgi:hypothetical protein